MSAKDLRKWLQEHDAEKSWVFDMAPVRVAPTKNVIGHVQIVRPGDDLGQRLTAHSQQPGQNVLVIEKLFVRPDTYEHGIARFFLREAVRYIQGRGKLPVLDFNQNASITKNLCQRSGFEEVTYGDPAVTPMIYTQRDQSNNVRRSPTTAPGTSRAAK